MPLCSQYHRFGAASSALFSQFFLESSLASHRVCTLGFDNMLATVLLRAFLVLRFLQLAVRIGLNKWSRCNLEKVPKADSRNWIEEDKNKKMRATKLRCAQGTQMSLLWYFLFFVIRVGDHCRPPPIGPPFVAHRIKVTRRSWPSGFMGTPATQNDSCVLHVAYVVG